MCPYCARLDVIFIVVSLGRLQELQDLKQFQQRFQRRVGITQVLA